MNNIETDRLTICPLTTNDAEFIFELVNTPEWLQFIGDRGIKSLEDARNYILNGPAKSYAKNGFGLCLVKLKTDDSALGICGLIKRDTLADIDLGFAFLPQYSGLGYAYESAMAILNSAQSLSLKRIVAITTDENTRSIHLLEKLGLSFENKIKLPGEDTELLLFSILLPARKE